MTRKIISGRLTKYPTKPGRYLLLKHRYHNRTLVNAYGHFTFVYMPVSPDSASARGILTPYDSFWKNDDEYGDETKVLRKQILKALVTM